MRIIYLRDLILQSLPAILVEEDLGVHLVLRLPLGPLLLAV
jgi:hypothetical protein